MNTVLVLGGSGLVGKAIINELNKDSEIKTCSTYYKNPVQEYRENSYMLNIDDIDSVDEILNTSRPQRIISCLRGDYDKQLAVHVKAAEYLRKNDGRMFFLSTTNVFDNDRSRPHYENDIPDSCTDYGQYKMKCEKRIMEILKENACILRLPQMWGKDSPRLNQLIDDLKMNEKIEVYPELFINTNSDVMLSKQIYYIIKNDLSGIFHLASEDTVTYMDFYNRLAKGLGYYISNIQRNCEEKGYFALLSNRYDEFPEFLRIKNESVINYLTDKLSDKVEK